MSRLNYGTMITFMIAMISMALMYFVYIVFAATAIHQNRRTRKHGTERQIGIHLGDYKREEEDAAAVSSNIERSSRNAIGPGSTRDHEQGEQESTQSPVSREQRSRDAEQSRALALQTTSVPPLESTATGTSRSELNGADQFVELGTPRDCPSPYKFRPSQVFDE
ncbi:MAG: hypothetical protein M1828_004543 [Chrysothrix sp. TS-e1954]|nr:MAG: hypothetical protein M1828_004543 [Chrysothrix sp. TS-e1954]